MQIHEIAHILRAAKEITGETVFVVIGSQAAVLQFPGIGALPEDMLHSPEIDIWPQENPRLSDLIEGALGSGSSFHGHYGYHADGVSPETASLPKDWMQRSIKIEGHPSLNGAIAIAPEIHDLAASKMAAFREKDIDWVCAGVEAGIISPQMLLERILEIPQINDLQEEKTSAILSWVKSKTGGCDDPGPR